MKTIVTLGLLLVALPAFSGTIISHDLESPSIAKNAVKVSSLRHFEVYLPSGYDASNDRYPVLYYIPWLGGAASGMEFKKPLDKAIQQGIIPPTIVVLLEAQEGIWYLNSPLVGNWEDFMVSELIPFIDKTYRTIPSAQGRGLMGHSSGGYSAIMLSILHPNVWSAVGLNDPTTWVMYYPITDEADIPNPNKDLLSSIRAWFKAVPKNAASSEGLFAPDAWLTNSLLQMGASFSPNPKSPILCDLPMTPDGNWAKDIRAKWSERDLTNPKTIGKYSDILKKLSSISIVVPEPPADNVINSNRIDDIFLIEKLQAAGITITRLDMPGDHGTDRPGRLVALAEQLLKSMQKDAR